VGEKKMQVKKIKEDNFLKDKKIPHLYLFTPPSQNKNHKRQKRL